jgi:hypothetical protein
MAVSRRLRFEILRRDGHTCRYCGASAPDVKLTVDHVVPTALGGGDQPSNLVTACEGCNGGKSSIPADAALVANVATDALRWSRAIQAAADEMLADLEKRHRLRAEFDEAWQQWGVGQVPNRIDVPRPDDWAGSVDRFLAAGLPLAVLVDCLDTAMRRKKVTADSTFRYMCGIAWQKVTEIQGVARNSLGATVDAEAVKGEGVQSAVEFAREILNDHFTEEERLENYETYLDANGEPRDVDMTKEEATLAWTYDTVSTATFTLSHLRQTCLRLLDVLPADEIELCDRASLEEERMYRDEGKVREKREDRMPGLLSGLAAILRFRGLPTDAQESYLAWANPEWSDDRRQVTAARWAIEASRMTWLCLDPAEIEGHAPCLSRGAVRLWFLNCWRHEGGEECGGHLACPEHAFEYANGLRTNPVNGGPAVVARTEQNDLDNPPF